MWGVCVSNSDLAKSKVGVHGAGVPYWQRPWRLMERRGGEEEGSERFGKVSLAQILLEASSGSYRGLALQQVWGLAGFCQGCLWCPMGKVSCHPLWRQYRKARTASKTFIPSCVLWVPNPALVVRCDVQCPSPGVTVRICNDIHGKIPAWYIPVWLDLQCSRGSKNDLFSLLLVGYCCPIGIELN